MSRRRPNSAAPAEPGGGGRDANLRFLPAFCLRVWIQSDDPAIRDLAANLQQQLLDEAILYDFPLHDACVADDALLALRISAVQGAFSMELAVAARHDPDWAYPTVWQTSAVVAEPIGSMRGKIYAAALTAFKELVLAWKGQHRP